MAKKQTAAPGKLAGQTVAFVGKFGYRDHQRADLEAVAREEGATVVDGEKTAPNLLVEGAGVGGKPPAASAKIQKKHAGAQVLDAGGFYKLTAPTADEFLALLAGPPRDWQFWERFRSRLSAGGTKLDLSGRDLRKVNISSATLYSVSVDGCDFRHARLDWVSFDKVKGATFDGAEMREGSFSNAEDCSLKRVQMHRVRWNPAEFVRCDFTGARLAIDTGSYTRATDCSFADADLIGADLDNSHFTRCDFGGANLTRAKLHASDFTDSDLSGADLTAADLRDVKFTNADLRKAKFRDALLTNADFTGANVAGADFTGANLAGAVVTGLDVAKAKGFVHTPARTAGPKMLELAKVAKRSKHLATSIELDLGGEDYVSISVSLRTYGTQHYTSANHTHYQPAQRSTAGSYANAPTFEQGMANLVDLWSKGTPRLETVQASAKKCPLKPKELRELARAAWCEALDIPIPTADEWQKREEQLATEASNLRETMLAELGGDKPGVKKFNAHTDKERTKLGSLRRADFSQAHLAGAALNGLDLRDAKFDGAVLSNAHCYGAKLQGASFTDAIMSAANLAGSKSADAVFAGAMLTDCNLRHASFLRANFRNADLSGTQFHFSDLSGADFTGATLTNVVFEHAKFDADTKFPKGFKPPEHMIWKGSGPHPGKTIPKVSVSAPGSVSFDAFFKALTKAVDPSRVAKATAMLKAERFQLFADVNADAVAGVVKSQSSKELVYACRLASDGRFSCGTQNLKPCGGLQGALCKHLLVLVVGLAKAGTLDPATAGNWVGASKANTPALDKDAASDTFLKYKGAEAGEIDWRPTETVPEDFYAM